MIFSWKTFQIQHWTAFEITCSQAFKPSDDIMQQGSLLLSGYEGSKWIVVQDCNRSATDSALAADVVAGRDSGPSKHLCASAEVSWSAAPASPPSAVLTLSERLLENVRNRCAWMCMGACGSTWISRCTPGGKEFGGLSATTDLVLRTKKKRI